MNYGSPSPRRIIDFATHQDDLNGTVICCMFNKIIYKNSLPQKLSSDNDPLFQHHQWKANLKILQIEEVKSLPYIPLSHPFIERLIKSIRNELLDRTLFWNSGDLQRKLDSYKQYFNEHRSHSALNMLTPGQKSCYKRFQPASFEKYRWESVCRGLFQLPIAV